MIAASPPALPEPALKAGFSLEHHAEIGSTNTAAKAALARGADRLWIVADCQIAGRGRHERDWASPPGNLHATLALRAPCTVSSMPLLGFVAGVALAGAVHQLAPALASRARLKWPNDLLIDGVKASGILLEAQQDDRGDTGIVIGIGVNVAHVPEGLDQPATALAAHAAHITRDSLFAALAERFVSALTVFDGGDGFAEIRALWLDHALQPGHPIRVRLPQGTREGRFAGIDTRGALLIDTEQGRQTLLVGDVFAL